MSTALIPKRPRSFRQASLPSIQCELAFSPTTIFLSNRPRSVVACSSFAPSLTAPRLTFDDPTCPFSRKSVPLPPQNAPPSRKSAHWQPSAPAMTASPPVSNRSDLHDISDKSSIASNPLSPSSSESSSSSHVAPTHHDESQSNLSFSSDHAEHSESTHTDLSEKISGRVAWNKGKKRSPETRRKISYTMLGHKKSESMRAKVSETMKGRIPWNKGKKLSPETRARMSAAHVGRNPWNKASRLSKEHRDSISESNLKAERKLTDKTRLRMRMSHRRPGDALVAGSSVAGSGSRVGSYSLIDGAGINEYILLKRELRIWSDDFVKRNSRRPSLADIRRTAPVPIIRKFENYVKMRDQIRGLAGDVYGDVDPANVPVVSRKNVADSPRNNSADRTIHMTKHGNPRMVSSTGVVGAESVGYKEGESTLAGALDDMWDMYDTPSSWEKRSSSESDHSLIGAHELYREQRKQSQGLSANDYRKIGRYRLMGAMDINKYVKLRKELQSWSGSFKIEHGRTPTLSDAKNSNKSWLYGNFCEYLEMRDRMFGLVEEVYGTGVDDEETLKKVNDEGKEVLDTLLGTGKDDVDAKGDGRKI